MAEIQFYHLTSSPLEQVLPKLVEKSRQAGLRVRLRCVDEAQAESLNMLLWTYRPDAFLAHGTAQDGAAEQQPVYLGAGDGNPSGADLLMILDGATLSAPDDFKRVLDLFDGSDDDAVTAARARWKEYQAAGHGVSYIRQNAAGGWEKQS